MTTQIKINELKGTRLKRDLGLLRAIKSYQNKHKDKSGNFGFVLVFEKDKKEVWFRLDGDYNKNQEIINLKADFYGGYIEEHEEEYKKIFSYIENLKKNGYNTPKTQNTPQQEEILSELRQYSGSEQYFKSSFGKLNLTEGINYLRNRLNCFWLIDIIESVQHLSKIQESKNFILWRIERNGEGFKVTAREDTNTPILYEQKGVYTDFPLKDFEFYQIQNVLLLKSEY
jgi:hypothetical protein